jgi:hypothetical protein
MYGAPENNKTHTDYSNGMSLKCMELLKTIKHTLVIAMACPLNVWSS